MWIKRARFECLTDEMNAEDWKKVKKKKINLDFLINRDKFTLIWELFELCKEGQIILKWKMPEIT
jgi:hypothetical protein